MKESVEALLTFANTISPLGVIALLVVVVLQLLNSKGLLSKLRGTQVSEKEIVKGKADSDAIDLMIINKKLDTIASNHLHGLPEMKRALDRIEEEQVKQGNRLTGVETTIKILLK